MASRAEVEGCLSDDQYHALREICRDLGFDPGRWREVPALKRVFEQVAAVRVYRRALSDGATKEDARTRAHLATGVNVNTIGSRMFEWQQYAEGRA